MLPSTPWVLRHGGGRLLTWVGLDRDLLLAVAGLAPTPISSVNRTRSTVRIRRGYLPTIRSRYPPPLVAHPPYIDIKTPHTCVTPPMTISDGNFCTLNCFRISLSCMHRVVKHSDTIVRAPIGMHTPGCCTAQSQHAVNCRF